MQQVCTCSGARRWAFLLYEGCFETRIGPKFPPPTFWMHRIYSFEYSCVHTCLNSCYCLLLSASCGGTHVWWWCFRRDSGLEGAKFVFCADLEMRSVCHFSRVVSLNYIFWKCWISTCFCGAFMSHISCRISAHDFKSALGLFQLSSVFGALKLLMNCCSHT